MYATLRSAQRQQTQRGGVPPPRRLPQGGNGASRASEQAHGGAGGSGSSLTGAPRVLGVPAASSKRSGLGVSASMPSLSGISHAHSWGAASELSSISSLRQASEDWSVGGDSHNAPAGGSIAHASMDLAAIDEAGSITSLSEELYEKNRTIEHLQVGGRKHVFRLE
jgi:hypothetical protein